MFFQEENEKQIKFPVQTNVSIENFLILSIIKHSEEMYNQKLHHSIAIFCQYLLILKIYIF